MFFSDVDADGFLTFDFLGQRRKKKKHYYVVVPEVTNNTVVLYGI